MLGLPWNKEQDSLSITVPPEKATLTKRGILAKLAKIYGPLGLVLPETLSGKLVYCTVCDTKGAWDAHLSCDLAKLWVKWESRLPERFAVPRSLVVHWEEIEQIDLHSFGDVCANGLAACVYAVIWQASGTNQGLIAARSRLSKQGLTIPRLELVSGHMAVNLVDNVRDALDGLPVRSTHCWLDSSVALYWIRGQGEYKQFMANRVQKIKQSQRGDMALCSHSRESHWSCKSWRACRESWSVVAWTKVAWISRTLASGCTKRAVRRKPNWSQTCAESAQSRSKREEQDCRSTTQVSVTESCTYLCVDAEIRTQLSL